ncbi:MAG TPA: glycosyltransferase family 2 protein [Chloroflexota bacterium]|nr:glycosyltransferase family 2 protein [Chloroflexota bacterium]
MDVSSLDRPSDLISPATEERPVISVVAPVFNEEEILPAFCARMSAVLEGLGDPWEIILVNDGSRDRSLAVMRREHARDSRIKVVSFSRNFGGQLAITAGLDYARGDAVVVIDADLQDPPEVVVELVKRWREGYEVVYAQREHREGETFFKKITAAIYYRVIRSIANVDIPLDTGEFRLLDRKAADALRSVREQHRYIRGLAAWIGFRTIAVPYQRAARVAGETKYPLRKMIRLAVDGITNFSYLPLQLATYAGFFVAGVSLLGILIAIVVRLIMGHELTGQATTLVSVLFLGGIQLIFLGIIGEYLGRIYDEVKNRPLYIVDEALGLPPPGAPPEYRSAVQSSRGAHRTF